MSKLNVYHFVLCVFRTVAKQSFGKMNQGAVSQAN